jgi:HJR/Mrr/RecB family endonuclease
MIFSDLGRDLLTDILGTPETPHLESEWIRPLSRDAVHRLTPERFEALIAVLEEKQRAYVILTPYAGDGGIDVIAARDRQIRLIQCKRTTSVDAEVVAEVMQAFDGYRARWPRLRIGTYILRAVLVTNGAFTAKAQREAKIRGIDLIAADDLGRLLVEIPCTLAEVEMMEDRRLASMRDVQVAIESLVRSLP